MGYSGSTCINGKWKPSIEHVKCEIDNNLSSNPQISSKSINFSRVNDIKYKIRRNEHNLNVDADSDAKKRLMRRRFFKIMKIRRLRRLRRLRRQRLLMKKN
jgi:hypothetical protein